MYYLQSRYYDAAVGRFINGDDAAFATVLSGCVLENNLFCYACNDSVLNFDPTGHSAAETVAISKAVFSQMVGTAIASKSLMASIKAFVTMAWNIFISIVLLIAVVVAIVYICKTISTIYDRIKDCVNADEKDHIKYNNQLCVYVLASQKGDPHSIFYVGRTQTTLARYNHHQIHKKEKMPFYMFVVYTCDSLLQSRVVEQCVLACCLTGHFTSIIFGEAPSNKINGISRKKAQSVISALGKEKEKTRSLLGCTPESDLLLLMGY